MLRYLIFLTTIILLSSCAKHPHQELNAAEHMVGKAYAMQAAEFAPTEYQAARNALTNAHQAIEAANYNDARNSLEFSLKHARRAVALTEERQAKHIEEEARRAMEEEKTLQAIKKAQAEEAGRQAKKQQPTTKPKPKPKPKAKPKPKPKPKVIPATSYTVGDGETLWTISAQPQVYNEGLLWPLLYQANRDQIKDPRQIFPKQSLSIRRDMTQMEMEEARQKARQSDIFPIPEAVSPKQ
jgi:nucleoid-associated protein YgaU